MQIPDQFIISAGFDRYLVFKKVNNRLTALKKSDISLRNLRGDGEAMESGEVGVERDSEHGLKTYITRMTRLNRWLQIMNERIYEYKVTSPCLTLPSQFYNVFTGKDLNQEWHHVIEPQIKQPQIPPHVLKGFVNGLIVSKEICPITMDELVLGKIAITDCYHAFDRSAINEIMNSTRLCPTCRGPLRDIMLF
jgi:hypothetical protein